jgi:hypothetical protein
MKNRRAIIFKQYDGSRHNKTIIKKGAPLLLWYRLYMCVQQDKKSYDSRREEASKSRHYN